MIFRQKWVLLSLFALLLSFQSPLSAALKTTIYLGKTYVYLQEVAKDFGMTMTKNQEFCTLKNTTGYMSFQFDKKTATINGIEITLLFPTAYNSGAPIISQKDFSFVLEPIIKAGALKRQYVRTVILDPGHGGDDNGASGVYSKEKNISLIIAQRVAAILIASGYKVVMTRNSDKFVPLDSRTGVIARYNADIFVSIHCNSAKKNINGYETFVLAPQGTSSTYSKKIVNAYESGNRYDKNNERLGYEINKALGKTGREDRGLKHARFVVLKSATKPAALVEAGFLSNRAEENQLNSKSFQDKVAKAIASGIISYSNAAAKGN